MPIQKERIEGPNPPKKHRDMWCFSDLSKTKKAKIARKRKLSENLDINEYDPDDPDDIPPPSEHVYYGVKYCGGHYDGTRMFTLCADYLRIGKVCERGAKCHFVHLSKREISQLGLTYHDIEKHVLTIPDGVHLYREKDKDPSKFLAAGDHIDNAKSKEEVEKDEIDRKQSIEQGLDVDKEFFRKDKTTAKDEFFRKDVIASGYNGGEGTIPPWDMIVPECIEIETSPLKANETTINNNENNTINNALTMSAKKLLPRTSTELTSNTSGMKDNENNNIAQFPMTPSSAITAVTQQQPSSDFAMPNNGPIINNGPTNKNAVPFIPLAELERKKAEMLQKKNNATLNAVNTTNAPLGLPITPTGTTFPPLSTGMWGETEGLENADSVLDKVFRYRKCKK